MDRDTFWETAWDMIKLVLKLAVILSLLQLVLILTGTEMKIPVIYKYMKLFIDYIAFLARELGFVIGY